VCYLRLKGVEVDEGKEQGGKSTKECQPHKAQKSLMGFFGGGGGGGGGLGGRKKTNPFASITAGGGASKNKGGNGIFGGKRGEGGKAPSKSLFATTNGVKMKKRSNEATLAFVKSKKK
jgi:hypothetical protein